MDIQKKCNQLFFKGNKIVAKNKEKLIEINSGKDTEIFFIHLYPKGN